MNFDLHEFFSTTLTTLQQHVPGNLNWLPVASAGGVALIGLILLVKGARLAPFIAGLAVLTAGLGGGAVIANSFHTPLIPTLVTTGLVGFVLGMMAFRLMQAAFLAACLIGVALSIYYVRDLSGHLQNYTSNNLSGTNVTLLEPGQAAIGQTLAQRMADIWQYLAQHAPNFQANFWTLTIATGLTGLLLGWLLPRVTRAACASTFGVGLLFAGAASALQMQSPDTFNQVQQWTAANMGPWSWAPLVVLWIAGLIHNFRQGRNAAAARPAEGEPAGRTAAA